MAKDTMIKNLARFAFGLLIGSAAVEGSLRLVEATPLWRVLPLPDASLYGPDDDTGYAHRPGVRGIRTPENRVLVEINSLGLRDRLDRMLDKPPGVIRWGVAGDSIIEAQQVPLEKTFAYLAEERLNQGPGQKLEVINLGLAGARPAVIAERLRSRAPVLDLDGIVVLTSVGEFMMPEPDDPTEYAGYVRGPDGRAIISHAFREQRSYRMRIGPIGSATYWAVEHSRLALLINNRKNAGLWAELAPTPAGTRSTKPCLDTRISQLESLWSRSPPGFSGARLAAFLSDLSAISRSLRLPMIVALRGLENDCPALESRVVALRATISGR